MTRITKERMLEIKSFKQVNSFFELVAFLWTFRRREFLGVALFASLALNVGLLVKYTDLVQIIMNKISQIW